MPYGSTDKLNQMPENAETSVRSFHAEGNRVHLHSFEKNTLKDFKGFQNFNSKK